MRMGQESISGIPGLSKNKKRKIDRVHNCIKAAKVMAVEGTD